jgi:hypothetical protein
MKGGETLINIKLSHKVLQLLDNLLEILLKQKEDKQDIEIAVEY